MQFQIHKSTNNQYFFRIVAANGQTLCHSETYTTKQNAIAAANLIKANAANAPIVDQTGER
jgi:uncharacterized protein YegP (UPF0339 family)